ncbi:uncharacterized protein LOC134260458 [Saccostrea cucullata]|uniref:uncharacterized protein LOC134260458 n=1 Tax=Saccostrea cuccullata TaxID=36930 RepID=UPI002ED3462B
MMQGFWEKREVNDSSISVASGQNLEGRSRFAKLGMATNDVLNKACRDVLESEIPSSDIENKVNLLSNKKRNNMKLYTHQEDLLKKAKHSGYKEFDVSLTYKCIRNICSTIPKPTKGKWGDDSMPAAGEVTVGDDIERIRLIRNELTAHVSSASTPQKEFDDTWSLMSDICHRLETFTGKKYLDDLKSIEKLTLRREDENAIIEKVKLQVILEKMKSNVLELEIMLKPNVGAKN